VGREIWKGKGRGTYTAEVQFFAPVSEAGGAVIVCAVASAVLERRKLVGKNFMMKNQVQFFFPNTTLSLERQNWIWKRRRLSSIMNDGTYKIWKKTVSGEWLFWDVCDSGDVLINLYSTNPDM
jgi:hypothetical protein